MATNFKCCKGKEHSNWFCLSCKNIFHRSCWERRSNYETVTGNFILCSKLCVDRAAGDESILDPTVYDEFKSLLRSLEIDSRNKDVHIEKLKRNSVSFYDDAEQAEQSYLKQIKDLCMENKQLKKNLKLLQQQILEGSTCKSGEKESTPVSCKEGQTFYTTTKDSNVQTDMNTASIDEENPYISGLKTEISVLRNELNLLKMNPSTDSLQLQIEELSKNHTNSDKLLDELKEELYAKKEDVMDLELEVTRMLQININLTEDLGKYQREIECLSSQLLQLKDQKLNGQSSVITGKINANPNRIDVRENSEDSNVNDGEFGKGNGNGSKFTSNASENNNKVLLLTDGYGKYLYNSLAQKLFSGFELSVLCKPDANLDNIIDGIEPFISDFSVSDFVVLFVGPHCGSVTEKNIFTLANKCFHSNLIICTTPTKPGFNYFQNQTLIRVTKNLSRFNNNIKLLSFNNNSCRMSEKHFGLRSQFLNKLGLNVVSNCILNLVSNFFTYHNMESNLVHLVISGFNSNLVNFNEGPDNLAINNSSVVYQATTSDEIFVSSQSFLMGADMTALLA
ncbi:unnamed protein product [Ceutorhynchus assimilis]|uniref:Uncharacterized protein n=1 Tax=Ceutorhynchus assimilis TaxID=467358 RepID=A0A9N9MGB8_9CUCU|nr:unnamed protein product [Ceutorhynchus assimilis]